VPWLAVVPLADAVTLPACSWPQNVVFVDAFHGGLLGDPSVRSMVEDFLAGGTPSRDSESQRGLPALRVAAGRVIRYAMARDENSWPAVVAPPGGGALTQAVVHSQTNKRPPGNGGRFFVTGRRRA
jgi:hypothetical protein